jgi:Stress responsive A/B Barrel Domain
MIRHIVMFTMSATDAGQRDRDIADVRSRLDALVGVVPGLRSMTFEPDLGLVADGHWGAVLLSEHDDNAALEGYQAHPAHREAGAFIASVTTVDRATVDYEA